MIPITDLSPIRSVKFTPGRVVKKSAPSQIQWDRVEQMAKEDIERVNNTLVGKGIMKLITPQTIITTIKEKWVAKLVDGSSRIVSKEEVIELFGGRFAIELQVNGKRGHSSHGVYVDVPVGCVRSARLHGTPSLNVPNAPLVKFQQGVFDTCVYSSLASALFHTGLRQAAYHIQRVARKDSGCAPTKLLHRLHERIRATEAKFLVIERMSDTFDWKTDLKDNVIFVGAIQGSDGNAQHAVTLFQGWIFDSNEKTAIPLCKEGLDFCTQSEEEREFTGCTSTFTHFKGGFRLTDKSKANILNRRKMVHVENENRRRKIHQLEHEQTEEKRRKVEMYGHED